VGNNWVRELKLSKLGNPAVNEDNEDIPPNPFVPQKRLFLRVFFFLRDRFCPIYE
jgi:hypothetical protein